MLLKIKFDFFSDDDTLPRILENKLISHEQLDKIYEQYKGTLKLKHVRRLMKYPGYETILNKMEKSCIIDHPTYKERIQALRLYENKEFFGNISEGVFKEIVKYI